MIILPTAHVRIVDLKEVFLPLKQLGIKEKWFGIIDDTIVASGATKKQLQTNLAEIVPNDHIDRIYMFET